LNLVIPGDDLENGGRRIEKKGGPKNIIHPPQQEGGEEKSDMVCPPFLSRIKEGSGLFPAFVRGGRTT